LTAFSRAILDQVSDLTLDVHYELLCNGNATSCLALNYLSLRTEEKAIITNCLEKLNAPSILDLGACVGRHSLFSQLIRPKAKITIVERDSQLRLHCIDKIQPIAAYANFSEVDIGRDFDVILMLGLGLGIFGNESRTRQGLRDVFARLKRGGSLLIEGGKSTPGEFTTQNFSIRYGQEQDEPFDWGYATFEWLQNTLQDIRHLEVTQKCETSNGDDYFICQIKKHG